MWKVEPVKDKKTGEIIKFRVCDDGDPCFDFSSEEKANEMMDEWNERDYPLRPGM